MPNRMSLVSNKLWLMCGTQDLTVVVAARRFGALRPEQGAQIVATSFNCWHWQRQSFCTP